MAVPFAMRWEVSSLRSNHGSFVEAAKVKPLQAQAPGDWWVERPAPDLRPEHLERVKRRWFLASKLASTAWPAIADVGEDLGHPWAVVQTPGRRSDGTFPFNDATLALKATRGLALGVAEAESLLLQYCTSPHLCVRAATLACDETGRLRFHLATLDAEPDLGFPATPASWMWTAEEVLGLPQTARSNVFALGWLLTLMLTGRSPYGPVAPGSSEKMAKEALKPLVLGNKVSLSLPEPLRPVEAVIKRALAWPPSQRYPDSAAFADALEPFAPGRLVERPVRNGELALPMPSFEARYEALPAMLEARFLTLPDESPLWAELRKELERVGAVRAQLMAGDESVKPQLTPTLPTDQVQLTWKHGYVRALSVEPTSKTPDPGEARLLELTAFLQHPSFRFLTELTLAGGLEYSKPWLEVLMRSPPPALRTVKVPGVPANDAAAVDIAFRFPRWTWSWGTVSSSSSFFRRLFGR